MLIKTKSFKKNVRLYSTTWYYITHNATLHSSVSGVLMVAHSAFFVSQVLFVFANLKST